MSRVRGSASPAAQRSFLLLLGALAAASSAAWGPQGHRVAGEIAEQHLSDASRAAIATILGDEPLSSASNWADRMRADPAPFWQREAGAYHYVNATAGRGYRPGDAPPAGDAYTALAAFRHDITSASTSPEQRRLALRFSIHIVQDLHQPLHAGVRDDRGGNDVRVRIDGRSSNLHRVWDSDMINAAGRSDGAWTRYLEQAFPPATRALWRQPDPLVWIGESAVLSETLYPPSDVVDQRYVAQHRATLEKRLVQAGVRTAVYLNHLFEHHPAPLTDARPADASLWQRLKNLLEKVMQ